MEVKGLLDTLKLKLQDTATSSIVQDMIAMCQNTDGDMYWQSLDYLKSLIGSFTLITAMKPAPTGGEVEGEKYIVYEVGSGDWATYDNKIATLNGIIWEFSDPTDSTLYVNIADSKIYIWFGGAYVNVGGGGGSALVVKDEGSVLDSAVTEIDFIGANVEARLVSTGKIAIYCPPLPAPVYSPAFSITNAISTTARNVSSPTSEGTPFKIGSWSGGSTQNCTNTSSFTYTSVSAFTCETAATTLQVIVYDADGSTPLINETVTIDGNKVATYTGMSITITNYGAEYTKFKAAVSVNINYKLLMGNVSGRFSVYIVHHNVSLNPSFSQNNVFYDDNPNTMNMNVITMAETTPVLKYHSGVAGYNVNSSFTVNIDDIDYTNSDSYPATVVSVTGSEYGLSAVSVSANNLTSWTNIWNNTNASYNKTDWTFLTANTYSKVVDANVSAISYDWTSVETINSANRTIIINSLASTATRIKTTFFDETYRLNSSLTAWDSTLSLLSYDSGNGLQVENGYLKYPTQDLSSYYPNNPNQPNYSTATGDRLYYTVFWKEDYTNVNGVLKLLGNITQTNLDNTNVEIWISLDGTNWFDCNTVYNFDDDLQDGDGCRVDRLEYALNINNKLRFTLANLGTSETTGVTTANSSVGWGIFVKVVIKSGYSSLYLTELSIEEYWV
jgi:hypothetical protein